MSCNISSEGFNNPLLKELLQKLTQYFESIDSEFYVIGATARDIILSSIHNHQSARSTGDLDIAIAIPDWKKFEQISDGLVALGFYKSTREKQAFWYKKYFKLDIVPFGEVAKADDNIYWPPEEEFAMSIVGFTEVAKHTIEVTIDEEFIIKVASLPGVFILKLAAFNDKKATTNKHSDDLAFIINNYLEINQDRAISEHYDLYEAENFDIFISGATLVGRDVKRIIADNTKTLETFVEILHNEIDLEDESMLINQMLETHKYLKYEETIEALKCILQELK
ncbi:MAG: nucleotidyl transferase AbiEii/AbiGii toxin family protein [Salinivirgaceae bacterium]|jgi:predicted nucleotidyltransferase